MIRILNDLSIFQKQFPTMNGLDIIPNRNLMACAAHIIIIFPTRIMLWGIIFGSMFNLKSRTCMDLFKL